MSIAASSTKDLFLKIMFNEWCFNMQILKQITFSEKHSDPLTCLNWTPNPSFAKKTDVECFEEALFVLNFNESNHYHMVAWH